MDAVSAVWVTVTAPFPLTMILIITGALIVTAWLEKGARDD